MKNGRKLRLLVLNGPNMNMLGVREPEIYGREDYAALVRLIREEADRRGVEVDIRQSNHEGTLVDWIQEALGTQDGIIINPAAYTHTSVALLDAVRAVALPCVEVHLTDVDAREDFRHISYIGRACIARFAGQGFQSYIGAMDHLIRYLNTDDRQIL